MSFGILVLLILAGLAGPLLSAANSKVPVVVGEILGGLLIGATGFKLVNPDEPTFKFFSEVGFAMLMFIVGTRLPFRDPAMRTALKTGGAAAITTAALATLVAFLIAPVVGLDRPLILAVLMATSSAAVAMPILLERDLTGGRISTAVAWIAIADIGTMLAIPVVDSSGRVTRVLVGGALVLLLAGLAYLGLRQLRQSDWMKEVREHSKRRGWGLDLRISLLLLFFLALVATTFGTSILIAGFATGGVVALLGEPKRVAQQLVGLGEGFFVPLFFVSLGAKLDFRTLATHPSELRLGLGILAGAVVAHVIAARVCRLPVAAGLLATAELGVPSAVVTLGLEAHTLSAAQGAAIMAAVMGSMAVCAFGGGRLAPQPEALE